MDIGYCEYNCNSCGRVCPTGAITKLALPVKQQTKIGVAVVNKKICIPWATGTDCLVCEEHCPIADKAIQLREENVNGRLIKRPYIDSYLCVGCGICQNKCPVQPVRAVRVKPIT